MTIISKKPDNLSLVEYFNTLDVFDKRELIQELEVFNSVIKDSVKTHLFTLIVSLVVGCIFITLQPTLLVVSFYSIISSVILVLLFRKYSSLNKFNKVIDFLQQNM
jgi:ABC-type bacteriocin/lantibiotic exporter with double-glycine peptidase domain